MARGKRFDTALLPAAPDLSIESGLWRTARRRLAGIDEAGRGALAGPVAAAAVILPADPKIAVALDGVRDSKQMTAHQRLTWAERIHAHALAWGVGLASCGEIDSLGIVAATGLAAQRALQSLAFPPDYLLLDAGLKIPVGIPQQALVKGDCRSLSIAAASVLAKTTRDRLLAQYDLDFPGYGFGSHKGYGTRQHLDALERLGPSAQHRLSFAPLGRIANEYRIQEEIRS